MTYVIFNICLLEYSRNSIHEINSSVGHVYINAAGDKQIVLSFTIVFENIKSALNKITSY